jgi:hypothetical protein
MSGPAGHTGKGSIPCEVFAGFERTEPGNPILALSEDPNAWDCDGARGQHLVPLVGIHEQGKFHLLLVTGAAGLAGAWSLQEQQVVEPERVERDRVLGHR